MGVWGQTQGQVTQQLFWRGFTAFICSGALLQDGFAKNRELHCPLGLRAGVSPTEGILGTTQPHSRGYLLKLPSMSNFVAAPQFATGAFDGVLGNFHSPPPPSLLHFHPFLLQTP